MTTGGALSSIYSFQGGADGEFPGGTLVEIGCGILYGTAGNNVFRITTHGELTNIYTFSNGNDGGQPSWLIRGLDGNLYGTTYSGGMSNLGTIFRMTTGGVLQTLHSFTGGSDGGYPQAPFVQASDGYLYGTASGGTNGFGVIFRVSTNGSFALLYSFTGQNGDGYPLGLAQANDGNLYGVTTLDYGGLFRINPTGTHTNLYKFPSGTSSSAALVQGNDGNLYGAVRTVNGGGVFSLTANGAVKTVCNWSNTFASLVPNPLALATDNNLYGVTGYYPATAFRIVLSGNTARPITIPPPLLSNGNFFFRVPTFVGRGYTVQQSSNLASGSWNVYTNFTGDGSTFSFAAPITGTTKTFFRVREP
jgi:uncharacterized repeat protein (TIGR03803 family)